MAQTLRRRNLKIYLSESEPVIFGQWVSERLKFRNAGPLEPLNKALTNRSIGF